MEFQDRRRTMIFFRGGGATVFVLLAGMFLVSALDWFTPFPDFWRYVFSGVVYSATLAVAILWLIRPLMGTPRAGEVARRIEIACPAMHEMLISAVELGDVDAGKSEDSVGLRRWLQSSTVSRLAEVNVESILPGRRVLRWMLAAVFVCILTTLIALRPDGRQLLARAFAPMANIDRVSRTTIMLKSPTADALIAPLGDSLSLTIEVKGPDRLIKKRLPMMETLVPGGMLQSVLMTPGTNGTYSTTIAVNDPAIQLRFQAGDAVTRRFILKSQARPSVITFVKVYRYPAYTGLPARTVEEKDGDLSAIAGTEVELRLKADQRISMGELRMVTKDQTNSVTLLPAADPTEMIASYRLMDSGTFHVHLVAAAGNLESKNMVQYEFRALPDLLPSVQLELKEPELQVTPEELLKLRGVAADDIGLKALFQLVQTNNGAWITNTLKLAAPSPTNAPFRVEFDLLPLTVKPGDEVVTRFVAEDLNSQRAESMAIRLKIASAVFDISRYESLDIRRKLQTEFDLVQKISAAARKTIPADFVAIAKTGNTAKLLGNVTDATARLKELLAAVTNATTLIDSSTLKLGAGRQSDELLLYGLVLSSVRIEWSSAIQTHLDAFTRNIGDPTLGARAQEIEVLIQTLDEIVQNWHRATAHVLATEELDVIIDHLDFITHALARMNKQALAGLGKDAEALTRLSRRQKGVGREMEVVAKQINETIARLQGGHRNVADTLKTKLEAIQQEMRDSQPTGSLDRGQKAEMELAGELKKLRPARTELARESRAAINILIAQVGTAAARIRQIDQWAGRRINAAKKLIEARDKKKDVESAQAHDELAEETLKLVWKSVVEAIRELSHREEKRPDPDSSFAADLSKASLGLETLLETLDAGQPPETTLPVLARIADALEKLEAGHAMARLESLLTRLEEQERFSPNASDLHSARPKDWDWTHEGMDRAAIRLQNAKLPAAAIDTLRGAAGGNSAKAVGTTMEHRRTTAPSFSVESNPIKNEPRNQP